MKGNNWRENDGRALMGEGVAEGYRWLQREVFQVFTSTHRILHRPRSILRVPMGLHHSRTLQCENYSLCRGQYQITSVGVFMLPGKLVDGYARVATAFDRGNEAGGDANIIVTIDKHQPDNVEDISCANCCLLGDISWSQIQLIVIVGWNSKNKFVKIRSELPV